RASDRLRPGDDVEGEVKAGEATGSDRTHQPAVAPKVSEARNAVRAADPELAARFRRYQEELGVPELDADVLTGSHTLARLFEEALEVHGKVADVTAWVVNEVVRFVEDDEGPGFEGAALGTVLERLADDTLNRRGARAVLEAMAERGGGDPDALIAELGLEKVDDPDEIKPMVDSVLEEFADKVAAYREGNRNLLGLFMGQVMRRSGGKADPALVRSLLVQRLDTPEDG
ncbi:MAG: hypothetical protein P8188_19995, partial [Gemmatimonadota bacterium]